MNYEPAATRAADVLTPEQLIGLGKVAAEWGMLEASLNSHATVLTRLHVHWALLTGNPGGRRTAELLAEVLPRCLPEHADTAQQLVAVLRSIAPLADRRNDVLHAAWGNILEAKSIIETSGKSEPNWAYLMKQQGRTLKQFPMGADGLEMLALEIGDARLKINSLVWALPEPYGQSGNEGFVD